MPRKGYIAKREGLADPVYGSTLVNKFINSMMWDGKKSTSQGIFYEAMQKLQDSVGDQEEGRRSPHGRSQQGLCALSLVVRTQSAPPTGDGPTKDLGKRKHSAETSSTFAMPQHRHHGSHRRRQDDDDGAHPVLHGPH